ncbi:MAG: MucBP domain-containing protein [Clostridia bacterium]|nr:MucBP domain-containing protein [Clostridia bacterium]
MKKKLILLFIIMYILVNRFNYANAATLVTSGIRYVNATLYDINTVEYNRYARNMDYGSYISMSESARANLDKKLTLQKTGSDNPVHGWAHRDFSTNYNSTYCALQGLVQKKLVNDNIVLTYQNNNGISLFPSDSVLSRYPSVYPIVYKNYKFPFYKNSSGYYEFDSSTHLVSVDTASKKFNLYRGNNTGFTGFFPFNKYTDNLSSDSARNYNFTARIDIPFYMNANGTVRNSNGTTSDMVFSFRGDDDVWVFIDDTLVLDIGGCHGAVSGSINFRTKVATVSQGAIANASGDGIGAIRYPSTTNFNISEGKHTIKIFYCERATGESNFKATFNVIESGLIQKYIDIHTGEELGSAGIYGSAGDIVNTSAKSFTGYTLVQKPSTETYTLNEQEQIVRYYYAKNSQLTVKYIDENSGAEIVPGSTGTYRQGDSYTTDKKEFSGYTFTRDTGNTFGTFGRENINVVYYYKKNSAGVITKYLDQVTGEEIAEREIQKGLENDDYITTAKNINDYTLVATPMNSMGQMKIEETIVVYEYRKVADVITSYIDENTNEDITSKIIKTYKEGDTYSTEKKDFENYKFIHDTGNLSGTIARENIEVAYYYKKNSAGIIVRHIDQVTGDEIATSETKTGLEGDEYTTTSKDIDGYQLVLIPNNASGKMAVQQITIIYEYRKKSEVITRYVDENTGLEITDSIIQTLKEGDSYTTEKKEFSSYSFTRDTGNTSGTIARENIEVIYYYKKNSAGVVTKYIDQVTREEIADLKIQTGLENDTYTTESKDIIDYELVLVPEHSTGKMTVEQITVVYEYRKLANVITKHIDANTGDEIIPEVIKKYREGDEYEVFAQNLEGYTLVEEPEIKSGIVGREDITKVFKYKKISAGLVVKYVDEFSNEQLYQRVYTGNEKDVITLEELTFGGYVLSKRPTETEVELAVEPQEKIFYYKKIVYLEVVGRDKLTSKELYAWLQEGIEGEEYITESTNVPGYDMVEEPENKNGIYKRENDKVIYLYSKIAGKITVKYIDKDTNELLDSYEITGYVSDEYTTDKKEFEKYNFIEIVGNPNGSLEESEKEIIYYYEKKRGNVIVIYEDTEGNVLFEDKLNGKVDEPFKIEEREIPLYRIIKRPESTEGIFIEGTIELKYILEKIKGKITVNFIDRQGNIIYESVTKDGYLDEQFYLKANEKEGYQIIENQEISIYFVEGETVIDVVYEKMQEPPATGDINVILLTIIMIISILGITYAIIRKRRK